MNFRCQDKHVLNILNENISTIQNFFEINLNIEIVIKVLDYFEFKKEYKNCFKKQISQCTVGFICENKNMIIYLRYEDWDKTFHKNKDLEQFNKVIIHELVHMIHLHYCNKNYPNQNIWEGIAYYLSGQTGYDYYDFFKKIIDSNSHEQVLKLLKNDGD